MNEKASFLPSSFSLHCRIFMGYAALLGLLTVISSALVSHLPDHAFAINGRVMAHTANELLSWHAVTLLCLAFGMQVLNVRGLAITGYGFIAGSLCFGGAVFFTAFTGIHPGPIAPIGGSVLMLSWFNMFLCTCRRKHPS